MCIRDRRGVARERPGFRLAGPRGPDDLCGARSRDRAEEFSGLGAELLPTSSRLIDLEVELQVRVCPVRRRVDDELRAKREGPEVDDEARDLARVQELDVRREGN